MMTSCLEIDVQKKTISLPKFSLLDFTSPSRTSLITPLEYLRCLAPYIARREDRNAVDRLMTDASHLTIKFKNIVFGCRMLSLYSSSAAGQQLQSASNTSTSSAANEN